MKTTLIHWLKFNLVGVIGIAVQLSSLALFNRWLHGPYLLASAAALELTLLHNFVWHLHYTWRDSKHTRRSSTFTQLLRFHLSNGLVSLVGNLALMRLLVAHAHLPVLAANAISICCCSLANFFLSQNWVFAATRCAYPARGPATSPHA
jgi:dolichol-phosphate mannosyltransferase